MDHAALTSQFRASLAMLRSTIDSCPEDLWKREKDRNPFWALAYHAIFFAHLYLSPSEEEFTPFQRQAAGREGFGRSDLDDWTTLTPDDVYAKEDVLAYLGHVDSAVERLFASKPFDAESGFHWLTFSRGEAHLYNLRHVQHHAGQLAERLRQELDAGTRWVGAVR